MPYEPSYTWRTAVLIFASLLFLLAAAVLVGLLIANGINPIPYRDPEPPPTT